MGRGSVRLATVRLQYGDFQRVHETQKAAVTYYAGLRYFIEGAGTRTRDLRIKSPLLYRLSYALGRLDRGCPNIVPTHPLY